MPEAVKSSGSSLSAQRSLASEGSARTAETQLDALLQLREHRMKNQTTPALKEPPPDPVEVFRRSMEKEYVGVLDELAAKYISKGVIIEWSVEEFLAGGREVTVEFAVPPHRVKLRGTVARDVIAFELTRYVSDTGGEVASGPMLRLRTLDKIRFREFLCEQIALLIRSVLRVTRG